MRNKDWLKSMKCGNRAYGDRITPKSAKNFHAKFWGKTRPSSIKRTRKRQIAKARHMMAEYDHTCYEWSQWWKQDYGKFRRETTRYSRRCE